MKHTRLLRNCVAVLALAAMVATACGGGITLDADDQNLLRDSAAAADERVGTASADTATGGNAAIGAAPVGAWDLNETYEFAMVATELALPLSIPAGSITTLELAAGPENSNEIAVQTADGSFSVYAAPGGSVAANRPLITAAEAGVDTVLTVVGVPGDAVSVRIITALQTESEDGGDAPELSTGAVVLEGERSGVLGGVDQVDYFVIDTSPGDIVEWTVSKPADSEGSIDAKLKYNGERVGWLAVSPAGTEASQYRQSNEQTDRLYMEVTGRGSYELSVSLTPQTDGGGTGDAGGESANALDITPGTLQGQLGDEDRVDYYRFDIEDSAILNLTLRNDASSAWPVAAEIQVNGETVLRADASPGGTSDFARVVLKSGHVGEAFLLVGTIDGHAAYEVDLGADAQTDGGSNGDAPIEVAAAAPLDVLSFSGILADNDIDDAFAIIAPKTGTAEVSVTADGNAESAGVRIYVDDTQVAGEAVNAGATEVFTVEIEEGATLGIAIRARWVEYDVVIAGDAFAG